MFRPVPPDNNRTWAVANCDLAIFNVDNFKLLIDIEQLYGIAEHLNNTHIGYVSGHEYVRRCN